MVGISWVLGSRLLSAASHHRRVWNTSKSHTNDIIPALPVISTGDSGPTLSTFTTRICCIKNILVVQSLEQDGSLVSAALPWNQILKLTFSMGGRLWPQLHHPPVTLSFNPVPIPAPDRFADVREITICLMRNRYFSAFKNKYSDLEHFKEQGDPHHLFLLTVFGKPADLLFKSHYIHRILFSHCSPFFFRWDQVRRMIPAPFSQFLPTQNNSPSSLKICAYPQSVSQNAKTIYLTFTPANAYIRTRTYIWT